MKLINNLRAKDLMLLLILIVFTILTINVFSPYINIIILSLILVQLFHPVYFFIKKYTKSNGLATILSIILVLVLIVLPIALIVSLTINEIQILINSTKIFDNLDNLSSLKDIKNGIDSTVLYINNLSENLSKLDLQVIVANINQSNFLVTQVLPTLREIVSLAGGLLFATFLLILSLIYMFPAYENLPKIFARFSPLDSKYDNLIYSKFINTLKGSINGSFIVAIAQATAVIIPMIFMGVGAPVLLWIVMLILSIVPVGSGLVWAPVGIFMIIQGIVNQTPGNVLAGIFLIVYSAIIINVLDSFLRPKLIKGEVNLHPLVTILSVIGGIGLFGFFGILYGPLIVVVFVTLLEIYKTNYLNQKEEDEG